MKPHASENHFVCLLDVNVAEVGHLVGRDQASQVDTDVVGTGAELQHNLALEETLIGGAAARRGEGADRGVATQISCDSLAGFSHQVNKLDPLVLGQTDALKVQSDRSHAWRLGVSKLLIVGS